MTRFLVTGTLVVLLSLWQGLFAVASESAVCNSLDFDGEDDWALVPGLGGPHPVVTLEAWVRFGSLEDTHGVWMDDQWNAGDAHLQVIHGQLKWATRNKNLQTLEIKMTWAPQLQQWYFISIVHDSPGQRTAIYVDGHLLQEARGQQLSPLTLTGAHLGSWSPSGAPSNVLRTTSLQLGSLRVWSLRRDGRDASVTAEELGLELYYPFTNCSSSDLTDFSGHGRTGTVKGASRVRDTTLPSLHVPGTTEKACARANVLGFYAAGDRVTVRDLRKHDTDSFSVVSFELWVKFYRLDGNRIIYADNNWDRGDVHVQIYRSRFVLGVNGKADIKWDWQPTVDRWHFIVVAYLSGKSGKCVLYVDSILRQEVPRDQGLLHLSGGHLGAWQTGPNHARLASMRLATFRIWSIERFGEDSCANGPEDGLLLLYKWVMVRVHVCRPPSYASLGHIHPHSFQAACGSDATTVQDLSGTNESGTIIEASFARDSGLLVDCSPSCDYQRTEYANAFTCMPLTMCNTSEWRKREPSLTSDHVCAPLSICDTREFVGEAATSTSDRKCEPCIVCPPTHHASRPCGESGNTVCSECSACGAGMFTDSPCTDTADTKCLPCSTCKAGTWRGEECGEYLDAQCQECRACGEDSYETAPCSTTADRVCSLHTACGPEQYEASPPTGMNDRVCATLTICNENLQFEEAAPTVTSDRKCTQLSAPCSADEWMSRQPTPTSDRECTPISSCGRDSYVLAAATSSSDVLCDRCTVCPRSHYETHACTKYLNSECDACTTTCAQEDTYLAVDCTDSKDAVCAPCRLCPDNHYRVHACAGHRDTICKECTQCRANEYTWLPCSRHQDAVCVSVSVCSRSEYELFPPSLTTDRVCVQHTRCNFRGEFEVKPPTLTSDRICHPFTFCTENEFILRGVTHTSDRVCTHTSTCPPGQEEIMAPTLRSDRRCRSCTHYQIGAPTTRRDRVCKRLTPPCDPSRGLFEVMKPTATSDRVCQSVRTVRVNIDADYDTFAGDPGREQLLTAALYRALSGKGVDVTRLLGVIYHRSADSKIVADLFGRLGASTSVLRQELAGSGSVPIGIRMEDGAMLKATVIGSEGSNGRTTQPPVAPSSRNDRGNMDNQTIVVIAAAAIVVGVLVGLVSYLIYRLRRQSYMLAAGGVMPSNHQPHADVAYGVGGPHNGAVSNPTYEGIHGEPEYAEPSAVLVPHESGTLSEMLQLQAADRSVMFPNSGAPLSPDTDPGAARTPDTAV